MAYPPTPLPTLLASGLTLDSTFVPFELWAGESDIVTSQGMAGATLAQYTVVARDANNNIVQWAPGTADGAPVNTASGTITFSAAPVAAETVTIAGSVATWTVAPAVPNPGFPAAPEGGTLPYETLGTVIIGADAPTSAQNLTDYINFFTTTLGVNAVVNGSVVTIYANAAGTAGNAITLAEGSTATVASGSTLTGGTVDSTRIPPQAKAIGFLAQPSTSGQGVPYYTGGSPNHEVLIWPAGIDTIAQRKAAFDGTNINISKFVT